MKKTIMLTVFCFLIALCFIGCTQESNNKKGNSQENAFQYTLMEPLPQNGPVVAKICGEDYIYDVEYIFRFGGGMRPEAPSKEDINFCLEVEVCAMEAKALGLSINKENYDYNMSLWSDYETYINQRIAANKEGESGESLQDLGQSITMLEENVKRYQDYMAKFCDKEGVNAETFWQDSAPYMEKYHYAYAYHEYLLEKYNSFDDYEKNSRQDIENLKEKYQAEIL